MAKSGRPWVLFVVAVLAAVLSVAGSTTQVSGQEVPPGPGSGTSLDGGSAGVDGSMPLSGGLLVSGVVAAEVTVQTQYPSRVVTVRDDDGHEVLVVTEGGFDAAGAYWEARGAARLPVGFRVSLSLEEVTNARREHLAEAGYSESEKPVLYQVVGGEDGERVGAQDERVPEGRSASPITERQVGSERFRWRSGSAKFQLYTLGGPVSRVSQLEAFRGALDMWNSAECTSLQTVYGGEIADTQFEPNDDVTAAIYWDADYFVEINEPERLGEEYTRWELPDGTNRNDTRYITGTVIVLNSGQSLATPGGPKHYDLQSVMAHEIGHGLGFDHVTEVASVMFSKIWYGKVVRELTSDDQSNVVDLYPCGGVPAFDDGIVTVTQSCSYFGDTAGPQSAGTALSTYTVTVPRDPSPDPSRPYIVSANWGRGIQTKAILGDINKVGVVRFSGRRPGEIVTIHVRDGNESTVYLKQVPTLSCSVPVHVEGTKKVPVDPRELAGVSVGQQCYTYLPGSWDVNNNDVSGQQFVQLFPIITNNTTATQSYVIEWNWYGGGMDQAFQWPPDQPNSFTTIARNFYAMDGSSNRKKLTLLPGETVPYYSTVLTGRKKGQVIGLRVLRDSSLSNDPLSQQRLSAPADGTEIFKATIKASACDDIKESVEVLQTCEYKRSSDNSERLQVSVTNGREVDARNFTYKLVFSDAVTGREITSRELTVDQARSGLVSVSGRRTGEKIRVTVSSELYNRDNYEFVTTLNSCQGDFSR